MASIFSGLITGAGFAGAVGDQLKVFDRPQNVGHLFCIEPEIFIGADEYKARFRGATVLSASQRKVSSVCICRDR